MVNFKKMDEKDFVFINRPANKKEDVVFNEFLKNRIAGQKQGQKVKQNKNVLE